MKKILLLIILMVWPINVLASVNTCVRNDDNMYIPDKINYKSSMRDSVLSTLCVDASEKVYDFADLFSGDEEINLYNKISSVSLETGFDIGIVTINNNNKDSASSFADDFYDYNEFSLDGVLFLIDMDNREYYFSTTGEAMFYFDDYRVNNVLDILESDMKNGYYYKASDNFLDSVLSNYNSGIVTSKYEFDSNGRIVRKTPWVVFGGISLIVSFIIVMILRGRNKKIKIAKDANKYLDGKLKLTNSDDRFLFKDVKKVYSPISHNDSSSGGFSSHSGSSGVSHGGGGRGF